MDSAAIYSFRNLVFLPDGDRVVFRVDSEQWVWSLSQGKVIRKVDLTGLILLTKRCDNGQWCLPGGAVDPGETVSQACEREELEETGLQVHVKRLIGIYSHSDLLVVYPDGNKVQVVALHFEMEVTGGTAGLSNEVYFGYFSVEEVEGLDFLGRHTERVLDTYGKYGEPVIK